VFAANVVQDLAVADSAKVLSERNRFPIASWGDYQNDSLKGSRGDSLNNARSQDGFERASAVDPAVCRNGSNHCSNASHDRIFSPLTG